MAMCLFKQEIILFIEDEEITDSQKQARKGIGNDGLIRLTISITIKCYVNFRIHRLNLMQYKIS